MNNQTLLVAVWKTMSSKYQARARISRHGSRLRISQCFVLAVMAAGLTLQAAPKLNNVPDAEKAMADTVDPWGLAFSDQLIRFKSHFATNSEIPFAVGYAHNLVKLWPNKYWFRGEGVFTAPNQEVSKPLWGVTGSHVSFQIAILPKLGAADADYKVQVEAPIPSRVYREEFVKVGPAAYPRLESEYWPDPLLELSTCRLSGTTAGAFWIELEVPDDFKESSVICQVQVAGPNDKSAGFSIPIRIVTLELHPKEFPLVAWFNKKDPLYDDRSYEEMISMCLRHHLQPLSQCGHDYLAELWSKHGPDVFQKFIQSCIQQGQHIFEIGTPPKPAFYQFLKEQNLLSKCVCYSYGGDEPNAKTFRISSIPWAEKFRNQFPGLRILLASSPHPDMEKGCDVWVTDLSARGYDPTTYPIPSKPELWHYYCHLPIHDQYRAPLVLAPNMQIDNMALEHRLALWMSWHFKAKGVLIWSGNSELPAKEFWKGEDLSLDLEKSKYPYAGIHHGNGFLVYPPQEKGGNAVPSLRLKILRDGMEDIAIFEAARKKFGSGSLPWLSPVPEVFQHPHYFDHLPETLLKKRETILEKIASMDVKP